MTTRSFLLPGQVIAVEAQRLQVKLRRLRELVEKGSLPKDEAKEKGGQAIREHLQRQVKWVNTVAGSRGLPSAPVEAPAFTEAVKEAVEAWEKVVDDL